MSRIGKKPVPVGKAKITVKDRHITVEGPKGKLEIDVHPTITVAQQDGDLVVTRPDDEKQSKALHGLTRALLANMVEGVTNGYRKTVAIQGVVQVALEGANKVVVTGADKQAVGQFAAQVRSVRKPEPYKGKGVR